MSLGYVLRRLGMFLLIVWVAASINFVIPRLAKGDPIQAQFAQLEALGIRSKNMDEVVAAYRKRLGLDRPMIEQYFSYISNVSRFNFGPSITYFPSDVGRQIIMRLPWSLGLLITSTILSFIVGNILGALVGWPGSSKKVRWLMPLLMPFAAIPYYLLGIIMMFVLAFYFKLFPMGGAYSIGSTIELSPAFALDVLWHAILPAMSIILSVTGFWMLGMRGMMITNMGEDYMMMAEAKGLSPRRIFFRYAMRNAMLPQVTGLALTFGSIIAGSVLVEVIFDYPGMGWILWQSIRAMDYFMIQGIVYVLVVSVALAMLILDFTYPLVDRRITYGR